MEELGLVFRHFREAGQYSLKEAAGDICSTSQLSRFELGESDLTVTKLLALLDNIHVNVENFLDKARNFQYEERIQLMSKLNGLYYANDIAGFQELQAEELEKAKTSSHPQVYTLNAILLQGLICQRNPQYRMEQADLDLVADYLFSIEEWGMYELILFGNLYSFYDVDYVYRMGKEVLERESFYAKLNKHRKLVVMMALNCYLHCLEGRAFDYANYFETYISKILGKEIKLYERTIFLYIKGFSLYQKEQKVAGIKKMQEAMHIFDVVGLDEQVSYYQEHFEKFVTLP